MSGLREAIERELAASRRAEQASDVEAAFRHLERAHVLGQFQAGIHVSVHARMLAFAIRRGDLREAIGQIPRLILAAPGSWTRLAPRGNTGGADVGIFEPMPVPADLEALLGSSRSATG